MTESPKEKRDRMYMRQAILQGKKAAALEEVPVGAVIVKNGKIIARGFNKRETNKVATAHAELLAIEKACKKLGDWRLNDCELFVTLEPCPMCAGAVLNARISRVVFGAYDPKGGCCGTNFNLLSQNLLSHTTQVEGGVLQEQCAKLLTEFFQSKRKK